jgi:hypothetical protein
MAPFPCLLRLGDSTCRPAAAARTLATSSSAVKPSWGRGRLDVRRQVAALRALEIRDGQADDRTRQPRAVEQPRTDDRHIEGGLVIGRHGIPFPVDSEEDAFAVLFLEDSGYASTEDVVLLKNPHAQVLHVRLFFLSDGHPA